VQRIRSSPIHFNVNQNWFFDFFRISKRFLKPFVLRFRLHAYPNKVIFTIQEEKVILLTTGKKIRYNLVSYY